jgi:O-antigen ligase
MAQPEGNQLPRQGKQPRTVAAAAPEPLFDRLVCWLAIGAVGLVPVLVTPVAYDPYRLPKEMLVRAIGIAILGLGAMRIIVAGVPRQMLRWDIYHRFVAIAVLWTIVCAIFSRNRLISAWSLADVIAYVAISFAIYTFGRGRWRAVVKVMLGAAVLNALSCILARFGQPHFFFAAMQGRSVGLLGSANDVGAYFAIVIIIALAMAAADRKWRWIYASVTALLIVGLATTQTLGAIAGTVAGVLAMTFLSSKRHTILLLVGLVFAAAFGILGLYAPLRTKAVGILKAGSSGDIDAIFPGRATAFLAAVEMVKDRPLTGVGPGCYGFEYFPYKLRVELSHPSLMMSGTRTLNFGETHNDHLQMLAQTGVPGYLILLAVLIWVGMGSFHSMRNETPARFSHFASLPLAICFAVVTLPEFVLELAAPTTTALVAATLTLMFRGEHAAS